MQRSGTHGRVRTHLRGAGALAVAGAASALLAACGGGGASASGASSAGKEEQAGLKFARCMREHGVNVPDPKPGARGFNFSARSGPGQGGPKSLDAADRACRHFLKGALKPPSQSQLNKMRDAALKWAKCMRQNGVNVPDPSTSGGGIKLEAGKGQGVGPDNAAFQNADRQCRHLLPGGGPKSVQSGGGPHSGGGPMSVQSAG
jgi:hypothetical protein